MPQRLLHIVRIPNVSLKNCFHAVFELFEVRCVLLLKFYTDSILTILLPSLRDTYKGGSSPPPPPCLKKGTCFCKFLLYIRKRF